jgi:type II secretory pathway pseudopilin PulG
MLFRARSLDPPDGGPILKERAVVADLPCVRPASLLRRIVERLRCERGVGLIELLTVMAVLGTVITPLVMSYATGLRSEISIARREAAYQNARLALQRLRVDIHCASGYQLEQNIYGGFTLALPQSDQTETGWCENVIPSGVTTSGVQWCTIPYPGSTTRWKLYRFLGTTGSDCDGGSATTFLVDYLAATPGVWPTNTAATNANGPAGTPVGSWNGNPIWAGNLWPTPSACTTGRMPTVAINFNVAVDPDNYPKQHYQLIDEIAMRNAVRCT